MSTADPPAPLRERITHWRAQGYRVVSETRTSAQLVRSRRFNPAEFIAMPIYLLEYLGQRDREVYIALDATGTLTETGSGVDRSRYRRMQDQPAGARVALAVGALVVVVAVLVLLRAIFP